MTVSQLGFQIDSSQAATAASDLDKLTSSATKAEQAAAKVSGAGSRMTRGFADLNPALDKIIGSLGRLEGIASSIDKRLDAMSSAAARAAKANTVLDQSAVEASSAYKQLEASLNAVTAAQKKADAAHAGSLGMIEKQKAAIASLNAELAKLRNNPSGQPGGQPNSPRPANSNFQTSNIASQLFDIGSTAAFMSPATVGLQQGPQLAQAFAGQSAKQALTGLAAGFAAIVSPVSLAAIGLTTAAAAAIQFGSAAFSSIGKASDALEKHDEIIKRIKDRYDAAAQSGTQFGQQTQSAIQFSANQDQIALQKALETGLKTFAYRSTPQIDWSQFQYPGADMAGITQQATSDQFGVFSDVVQKFREQARGGAGDVLEFNRQVQDIANSDPSNKALQRIATTLLGYTEAATKAAEAQKELNQQQRDYTMMMSRTEAAANAQKYQAANATQGFYRDRRFNAELSAIGARSPAQLAAAERARLEAEPVDAAKESPENRTTRINQQVELTRRRAQQQLDDAQRDRATNLNKTLADQQNEIDLIGKTGGAAASLRKEYELISQLRMEAARNGTEVDQQEIELIKQKTAEYGKYVDLLSQRKFEFDMSQQASDARLSTRDKQITTTLRQYGMPEDLSGANAAKVGQMYDWQQAKELAKGFGSAFSTELLSGSHDIGKSFLKGFQASVESEATKLWSKLFDSLGNMFADLLTGKSGSSAASGGLVGSVAAAFGGKAANSNTASGSGGLASVIPVTRSALPDISANTDVASYIAKAAAQRGIDPNTALAVAKSEGGLNSWNMQSQYFKNGVQEPSFGPFQLYKGGGLGNEFMNKTGLDPALAQNGPAGVDFALDYAKKNGWGAWYGAGKAGIGNWDGIGTGGAGNAAEAVNKLASASTQASTNLTGFGNGLGQLGQSLSTSFFPSAPSAVSGGSSGGGLFSWIGGLFSGGSGLSKYAGLTGLFADGTNYAPGGMAIVGERGPELVNLPQGSQVFNTNKSAQMMAGGQKSGKGGSSVTVPVTIMGNTYGDSHLQDLINTGVQQGLQAQQVANSRGGTGSAWNSWSANKG